MAALTLFEERLRGSDFGEPSDRETKGFDVRILEFNGFVHIEMSPANEPEPKRQIALFSLSEAREFLSAFNTAVRRVENLGEM